MSEPEDWPEEFEYEDGPDLPDDDEYDDCGLMPDGQCTKAGSEECDWDCGALRRADDEDDQP